MDPQLTVIIPIYNKEIYLHKLWDCLIEQTFQDYECLLIDDGSTDSTPELCDRICRYDNRFLVRHISNGGVSNARNVGIELARGEYITFIDADDTFTFDYLQNLYECISNNHVDLVISSSLKVWSDSQKTVPISVPFTGFVSMEELLPSFMKVQLDNGIYGFCWGKIFSRKILGDCRFDVNLQLAEDLSFYLDLYPKVKNVYFDTHANYFYLQNAQNSSMQKKDWEIDYFAQLRIMLKMKLFLEKMGQMKAENAVLLTRRIIDYLFFSIYYAPKASIGIMCKELDSLKIDVGNECLSDCMVGRSIRQKIVLSLFFGKKYRVLEYYLRLFRTIKRNNY